MSDENEDLNFDMEGALNELDEGLFGPEEDGENLPGEEGALPGDPPPAEDAKPTPKEPELPENADPVDSQLVLDAAPKTWRKEAAAHWGSLPPLVQQEIAKREQDMFKGIEGYKQEAAIGTAFRQVISPYLPILQQHGIDAGQHVSNLLQMHHLMATGAPEQKAALLQAVAQQFGVDLAGLDPASQPYVDPQIQALQAEINQLKSLQQRQEALAQQHNFTSLESQVAAFAAKPENIYFDEVSGIMRDLLQGRVAQTLEEAYDKAVYLHPQVREKELARQAAAKQEEARKKVEEARKATSANTRSSSKRVSGTTPLGSIDETLQSAYDDIVSRG